MRHFSNMTFMKCKLMNRLTTHLDIVVKIFALIFFVLDNSFVFYSSQCLECCKGPIWS
jgi:hypothetical protein